MSEVSTWGLIGPGNIGSELMYQLGKEHVANRLNISQTPSFIMRSAGIMEPDGQTPTGHTSIEDIDELPDVTFIAIPSTDDGKDAYSYICEILDRGGKVVTAEKGSLANNFDELKDKSDNFKRLGINATVGGGTRMLGVAREFFDDTENVTQLHLALNGTLSTIMSSVGPTAGAGVSLGQAVNQAIRLGYAEPGAESPYDVIKQEAEGDLPKKTAILYNYLGIGKTAISWEDLSFELTNQDIVKTLEEARVRRFIVSLYPTKDAPEGIHYDPEEDIIGGFDVVRDSWRIVGGFRNINRNPLFSQFSNITGAGNGFVIGLGPNESDGVYNFSGPGAGLAPTVNTMIDDYLHSKKY